MSFVAEVSLTEANFDQIKFCLGQPSFGHQETAQIRIDWASAAPVNQFAPAVSKLENSALDSFQENQVGTLYSVSWSANLRYARNLKRKYLKVNKWKSHIVDLDILYAKWHRRYFESGYMNTRLREIHTICIFALCLENNTSQRYAVAFQPKDQNTIEPVSVDELLDATFEVREEDCDLVLVDVPERGQTEVEHHRCQLTSFVYQPGTTERDWMKFLKKKLSYANDDDLRLVIHCEQEGTCNYSFLSAFLCLNETNCPYSQVFIVGQIADNPAAWQCHMLYPELAIFPVLTESAASSLLRDRPRLNKRNGHE